MHGLQCARIDLFGADDGHAVEVHMLRIELWNLLNGRRCGHHGRRPRLGLRGGKENEPGHLGSLSQFRGKPLVGGIQLADVDANAGAIFHGQPHFAVGHLKEPPLHFVSRQSGPGSDFESRRENRLVRPCPRRPPFLLIVFLPTFSQPATNQRLASLDRVPLPRSRRGPTTGPPATRFTARNLRKAARPTKSNIMPCRVLECLGLVVMECSKLWWRRTQRRRCLSGMIRCGLVR